MRLRDLPKIDLVLTHPEMKQEAERVPRQLARAAAREAVAEARARLREGEAAGCSLEAVVKRAAEVLRSRCRLSLRRCVNATGVVLHTGLGRAPLSEAAAHALAETAAGYCNIQADVGSGERMPREAHVEMLLRELTGAEAAAVVNNNAAATVLALHALAVGREVIVSRGEMVEIGGAFRLPDIIALSGCRLIEVGCTNRTHLRDYQRAITADTALLLLVHKSNYRVTGFTAQPEVSAVAALARERGIACAHDLGSGALVDLVPFGLPHEPTVREGVAAGVDVVFFSGDKLLGGPQCGVILGKRAAIEAMRGDPHYRTFRVDKLIISALEATLRLFLSPETLPHTHRVTHLLTRPAEEVQRQAEALAVRLNAACPGVNTTTVPLETEIGGGSIPGHTIHSWGVRLSAVGVAASSLANRLRLADPPVFARVRQDRVLLDLRTVLPGEDDLIANALTTALSSEAEP